MKMRPNLITVILISLALILISCSSGENVSVIATGKGAPAKAGQTGAADTSENDAPALTAAKPGEKVYILNVNSKVIHTDAGCSALLRMSEKNRLEISEEELEGYISSGYRYCTLCQGGEKG